MRVWLAELTAAAASAEQDLEREEKPLVQAKSVERCAYSRLEAARRGEECGCECGEH
ncbi:MAG: hypothetical protein RLZZ253_2881 [Verrucomicrobiota bacterium]